MTSDKQLKKTEGVALHLIAMLAGIIMIVLGIGLSVTMVLLPIGLPLGLVGLVLLICGLTPSWRT